MHMELHGYLGIQRVWASAQVVLMDTISDQNSFGKEIASERNIDWLNGVWFAVPKTKAGWAFMTLRLRIGPFSANGCLSY